MIGLYDKNFFLLLHGEKVNLQWELKDQTKRTKKYIEPGPTHQVREHFMVIRKLVVVGDFFRQKKIEAGFSTIFYFRIEFSIPID